MKCPKCGREYTDGKCPDCGAVRPSGPVEVELRRFKTSEVLDIRPGRPAGDVSPGPAGTGPDDAAFKDDEGTGRGRKTVFIVSIVIIFLLVALFAAYLVLKGISK